MMTIGTIGFLQPWILVALAALPAIWWLLRLTPPSPDQARERVGGLVPEPYAPDRAALATALDRGLGGEPDYSVLWLSDGLDYGEGADFAASLAKLAGSTGSFTVLRPGKDDAAL